MCLCAFHSQGLYGPERREGAFGEGLDLVVVERQQGEILQVLEGVGTDAVNLVGIQQAEKIEKKRKKVCKRKQIVSCYFNYFFTENSV